MEFDQIMVKDGPGLCRCCLSEGCYKDLSTEYNWMGENEIYADMLLECFDISISQHSDGPNGPNRLICEVCITRLRDACNFKKQVMLSEKKFVDMLGRAEFKQKAVIIYQSSSMKAEMVTDPVPGPSEEDGDIEYLEEELDFSEDYKPDETLESIQAEDITVSTLPIKSKRGRKRAEKSERRAKSSKASEEAKAAKYTAKGDITPAMANDEEPTETLSTIKRNRLIKKNAIVLLQYSNLVPFKWHRQHYLCFYCHATFRHHPDLHAHTVSQHENADPKAAVSYLKQDEKVKVDVTVIVCRLCDTKLDDLTSLVNHLKITHKKTFAENTSYGLIPFRFFDDTYQCPICEETYQYFTRLNHHMNKHYGSCVCKECGKSFLSKNRLRCHLLGHGAKFRCSYCTESFESLKKRQYHEAEVHDKKKTHKCFQCPETFSSYLLRSRHYKIAHNVAVPEFPCPYCGRVYHTLSRMRTHERQVHAKEKNHACHICGQKFFARNHVQKHMRMHFPDRVYQCDYCKKMYTGKDSLQTHMRLHCSVRKLQEMEEHAQDS